MRRDLHPYVLGLGRDDKIVLPGRRLLTVGRFLNAHRLRGVERDDLRGHDSSREQGTSK